VELFLVRHAHALPLGGEGGPRSDAERPLSEEGRARFAAAVRALEALDLRFARVEHSPLLRATQTAELLAPLLDGESAVNDDLTREPGKSLLSALTTDRTALVGHEPYMSELLALLAFGEPRAASGVRFVKGGVAHLQGEPVRGGMQLRALWPAKTLALLAAHDGRA
jgi:phosphohistidine phosphatase